MKTKISRLAFLIIIFIPIVFLAQNAQFVGAKKCGMCHKAKTGDQYKIWQESKHATAFKTLQSEAANKISKEMGFGEKASEAPECLKCHTTAFGADASLIKSSFKKENGVQCESCHGAGSKFKKKSVMKDRAKSVENGLTEYADEKAIEEKCRTCHNAESPTYMEFTFKEKWEEIKHPLTKNEE
ncbi:MAG: cytochrome C554 [Chlorobi bacterium]|nr:cytochrome C554 [Chlorobiota bacterium]